MYPQRLPIVDSDDGQWGDILRKYLLKEHYDTGTDSSDNGGHKNITIRPGTSGAGGAPIKFTSGTLLTTPEVGAMEFAGDNLYITQTSGAVRKKIAIYDDTDSATGDIYYRGSTGSFTRLAAGTASQILTISGGLPSWQTPATTSTFTDNTFFLQDDGDTTKKAQFQLSSITANNTRTLTIPNSNGTIYVTGGTDISVADGGTGRSTSTTAYGIIAAGTTATGAHQTIVPGTSGQFLKSAGTAALASFATITKSDVGLGNVDNTSDTNKPVSTATQAALNNLTADSLTRVKKQGYQPAGSDAYYKLATFPIDDSGNYASMIINGRLGGWVSSDMASWNIILANRSDLNDGNTIKAGISAIGSPEYAIGCTDLTVYRQADKSHILYIRIPADSYYSYDFNYNSVQATPGYTGAAEVPTGTDIWHLWSAPRIGSNYNRKIYGTDDTGDQVNMDYHFEAGNPWAIVQKDGDDNIRINTPTRSDHAVTKAYVDAMPSGAPATFNVKNYGAVGDGTTDDRAAIQACITASTDGSTILFPPGTYRVNATVYLKGRRTYRGTSVGQSSASVIKLGDGSNISSPIIASEVYGSAKTTCDEPLLVEDLCIDGNRANQTTGTAHGILLINYWSTLNRLYIRNCSGAAIKLTDVKASGTVTNSCSENKVLHCKLHNSGYGIFQESQNGLSNMDGYADDNLISDVTSGIILGRGAGWSIRRNHTYGVSQYGINISAAYATVVSENYIEDFGSAGASGYYSGISLTQLNDRASTISGNHVSVGAIAGAARLDCYNLRAGGSQSQAVITMAANSAFGTTASNTYGMFMEVQSGGMLTVGRSGHVYTAIDPSRYESINSGVRLTSQDQTVPVSARSSSYTLGLWDIGNAVEMTSASAVNLTIPPNSSQAFPIGTLIEVVQTGAGAVTIVAGSGVTINTAGTLITRAQYSTVTLRKRATDTWLVAGDTQ